MRTYARLKHTRSLSAYGLPISRILPAHPPMPLRGATGRTALTELSVARKYTEYDRLCVDT